MITVTWPSDIDDDVDTYVEDPNGNLVAFNRREQGLMHLDRDDVGFSSDRLQTPFGIVEYKQNREMVSLRGIVPGEYVVNVHMYTKRSEEEKETPVTILLEKINPYRVVTGSNVILKQKGDEKTAFRFVLNDEGEVTNINKLEKSLTSKNPRPSPLGP